MYRANLNFGTFDKYFRELLDKGLVEEVISLNANGCPVYKATERAKALLKELDKVDRYIGLDARNRIRWNST